MPVKQQKSGRAEDDAPLSLRERQRNALRSDIQQAALRLFAADGFDNVTTEAIAAAVGISPSTFFRHVPSKEYLLLGAAQRGRAKIVANFHARPPDEDIADSIAAAILTRTAQFVNDDETLELWRRAMASAPAELRRASVLNREDCDELISAVASRLDGTVPSVDIRAGVLVRAAVAAVEYAYEYWLTHDQSESLHTLTEQALELVTRGLATPIPPSRRRRSRQ
ncbi:TetR family transcriptional regulator [Mycolicibacterium sp.]|uniref:TetR family transcriptional regulator n=1 Tax=Mycolicibacterium sp. TaxID=2320850 RepID=UPI001A20634E|nr:TetR family transcriptional regulator [Mycolicibacterium sp.]MBJ7338213.1 TetR family transcriptional regulator [Mycolicibacterium sp.]